MRASVKCEVLRGAVNKVLNVVGKKNIRPILAQSLICVKDGQIIVSATDLEVSAKIKIPARVEKEGDFCVNPKNLYDILRELPNFQIELALTGEASKVLSLRCKDIHFTLLIHQSDDFPHLLFKERASQFQMRSDALLTVIEKTSHVISDDDTQIYFNGLFLHEVDARMRAVATDGNRLSIIDTELDLEAETTPLLSGIIVPRKGIYEFKRMAESFPGEMISLSVDDSFIYANVADQHFLSVLLIAQDYPKYETVIPTRSTFTIKADRGELLDAVKRIKIMSNEKYDGVRVKLKGSEMLLASENPILGAADEKLQIEYSGKDMEICFNSRYLMDALTPLEGRVLLEVNSQYTPVIFKSENLPNYLGVVMPLKL